MEDLKNFFEDVKRIRIAVEKIAPSGIVEDNKNIEAKQPVIPIPTTITNQAIAQQVQVPVNHVTVPTAVPVTAQAESFTQEQIAVAMSNAIAAGRKDIIDKILATYNAQCLMQIDASNYNQIAIMLREAGIQV